MKYQNAVYFHPPWTSKFDLICTPTTVERYEVWKTYIEGTFFSSPTDPFLRWPQGRGRAQERADTEIGSCYWGRQTTATIGNQYRSRCKQHLFGVDMDHSTRLSHPNCSMNIGWAPWVMVMTLCWSQACWSRGKIMLACFGDENIEGVWTDRCLNSMMCPDLVG